MPNANGKITAPVNTDDVCAVLGLATHDVGYLCANSHGRINPWAKFKPTRFDTVDGSAYKIGGTGAYRYQWQADDGSCGLVPPKLYSNLQEFAKALTSGLSWGYNAPDGSYWKRLADFVGYYHNAICPFGEVKTFRHNGNPLEFKVYIWEADGIDNTDPNDDDNLTLANIRVDSMNPTLGDCYLGLIMVNQSTGGYIAATSKVKISAGTQTVVGGNINYNINDSRIVDFGRIKSQFDMTWYKMYSFLANTPFDYSSSPVGQTTNRYLMLDGPVSIQL